MNIVGSGGVGSLPPNPHGYFVIEDHKSKFGTLLEIKKPFRLDPNVTISVQVGRTVLSMSLKKRWRLMPSCLRNPEEDISVIEQPNPPSMPPSSSSSVVVGNNLCPQQGVNRHEIPSVGEGTASRVEQERTVSLVSTVRLVESPPCSNPGSDSISDAPLPTRLHNYFQTFNDSNMSSIPSNENYMHANTVMNDIPPDVSSMIVHMTHDDAVVHDTNLFVDDTESLVDNSIINNHHHHDHHNINNENFDVDVIKVDSGSDSERRDNNCNEGDPQHIYNADGSSGTYEGERSATN